MDEALHHVEYQGNNSCREFERNLFGKSVENIRNYKNMKQVTGREKIC